MLSKVMGLNNNDTNNDTPIIKHTRVYWPKGELNVNNPINLIFYPELNTQSLTEIWLRLFTIKLQECSLTYSN